MATSRRQFLIQSGGAVAAAFLGLRAAQAAAAPPAPAGFGPLLPDPRGILDLPAGFGYRIVSRSGERMDDGLLVPGGFDGMAAFAAPGGKVRLVRNHELDSKRGRQHGTAFGSDDGLLGGRLARERLYDAGGSEPSYGGTSTLVYDPASGRLESQYLSLAGTERNCAGGATPWGSWLSCEESTNPAGGKHGQAHGWVFEVPSAPAGTAEPRPLKAMGRFNHEAAAVDPRTGIVYLTEDKAEGLFYRFVPRRPGQLAAGGRLEALALADWAGAITSNQGAHAGRFRPGQRHAVRWIPLTDVEAPDDDLRQRGHAAGAAQFLRGEGLWWGRGEAYFACTAGGPAQAGQIFRYRPGPRGGTLELFVESADKAVFDYADNLTVAPWGDLIACEDSDRSCGLVGVRPDGSLYRLAHHPYSDSELAGACFAPDGRTLFVNLQWQGLTLAIRGPFPTA